MSKESLTARKLPTSALADALAISNVTPDGLILTDGGEYVRTLEIARVPNLLSQSEEERERFRALTRRLLGLIPDRHTLVFHLLRDPLPPGMVCEPDRLIAHQCAQADVRDGDPALGVARTRLQRLSAATIREAASGDIGASWNRTFVQVISQPQPVSAVDRLRYGRAARKDGPHGRQITYSDHRLAAMATLELIDTVSGVLTDAGAHCRPVDGPGSLALAWERLHPAAGPYPFPDDFAELCTDLPAVDGHEAAVDRALLVNGLLDEVGDGVAVQIPAAHSITEEARNTLRHSDGTLERVLYLSKAPTTVDHWWLDTLSQTPLTSTVSIYLSPEPRTLTRMRARTSVARAHAAVDAAARKDKRVSIETDHEIAEKEAVQQQLDSEQGATIYRAGIYVSLRETGGNPDVLDQVTRRVTEEFRSMRDASLMPAPRGLDRLTTTLPFGTDRLNRRTRWAPSDVPYLVALSSSRWGHDDGIPGGLAFPHATVDRIDVFDSEAGTSIFGITGKGGHGKTMTANALAGRLAARGMSLRIIDRSAASTNEDGHREGGHWDPLVSLIPGAVRVTVGLEDPSSGRVNPWDLRPGERGREAHIAFLVAVHDLLIGEPSAGSSTDTRLSTDHQAILRNAIEEVYVAHELAQDDDAKEFTRPRETMLAAQLEEALQQTDPGSAQAEQINSLLTRLKPFWGDGPQSFLLDEPTTVPVDAPVIVYDTTGVPESRLAAVQLIVTEAISSYAAELKSKRDKAAKDGNPLPGWHSRVAVFLEECWHITKTRAGADWVEETARRARHNKMALFWITQFLTDLDSPGGRVLLQQTAGFICHNQPTTGLVERSKEGALTPSPIAQAAGLTVEDAQAIAACVTRRGEYSEAFVRTSRGKGHMHSAFSAPEFWALAQDPDDQQPLRVRAMQEAAGDPWAALALLISEKWRRDAMQA